MKPQQFEGVGIPVDFAHGPIIILSGSLETLKAYLGDGADYSLASDVLIAVGPKSDRAIELPSMAGLLAAREFAKKLDGNLIGKEITKEEEAEAKAAGLVVVFGYSDDCTEFRGAIRDEVGIGKIHFTAKGKFFDEDRIEELEGLIRDGEVESLPAMNWINATYGIAGHAYTTTIPHATFSIMEDGERFCEGIVFHISDLKS